MSTPKEPMLHALGLVTYNYQYLELTVSMFISFLLGPDQSIGRIVTTGRRFPELCKMLSAIFRHLHQDSNLNDRLAVLVKKAVRVEEERNRAIHSTWFYSEGSDDRTPTRYKVRLDGKARVSVDLEEVDPKEVIGVAEQISAATHAIMMFMIELSGQNKLSLPIPPQQ